MNLRIELPQLSQARKLFWQFTLLCLCLSPAYIWFGKNIPSLLQKDLFYGLFSLVFGLALLLRTAYAAREYAQQKRNDKKLNPFTKLSFDGQGATLHGRTPADSRFFPYASGKLFLDVRAGIRVTHNRSGKHRHFVFHDMTLRFYSEGEKVEVVRAADWKTLKNLLGCAQKFHGLHVCSNDLFVKEQMENWLNYRLMSTIHPRCTWGKKLFGWGMIALACLLGLLPLCVYFSQYAAALFFLAGVIAALFLYQVGKVLNDFLNKYCLRRFKNGVQKPKTR